MARVVACVCALGFGIAAMAAVAAAQDLRARGEKIFVDQKCGECHAIAGKGNVQGPLDDLGNRLTADNIRAWITDPKRMLSKTAATFRAHRKPEMKEYTLPKEDVDALVSYLSSLKKQLGR